MESQFWSRPIPAEDYLCEDGSKSTKYPFPIFADTPKPSVDDTDPWESYFSIIYRNIFCPPTFFRFCFGQTRLDTTSTQFGTMADGDSEVVFGKGRATLEHEPTSGVNLFARSNTDDTREPSRTLDEAPLQSSTPMVVRLPEAGDTLQAQENPTTETQTCHLSRPPKMVVRPETYSGKGDWSEYLSHFSDCAELGGWNDREKCLVLAANLRDAARKYYTGLSSEEKQDYACLTAALKRRFGGEHRQDAWLSKLEMRKRRPGESISEIGDDIWQMTQRAYYDFDHRSQEQLALKHFYRVIDADMKVKCFENKCSNILDAVNIVERYEALYDDKKDSRRTAVRVVESKPDATVTALERILEQLGRLEVRQARCESQLSKQSRTESGNPRRNDSRRPRSELTCFECGEKGHFVSQCPTNSNANPGNCQVAWGNDQPSNWRAKVWWIQKGLKNYIMESNHRFLRIVVVHLNVIQQFCFQTGNHLPASKILISEKYRMTMTLDPMLLKQVKDPVLGRMEFLLKGRWEEYQSTSWSTQELP